MIAVLSRAAGVRSAFAVSLLLLVACAGKDAGDRPSAAECDDAPVTTWDNFGAGFVTENCQVCHASAAPDRHDAPDDVTFDTEEDTLRWADRILERVTGESPSMPPQGGIVDDDRYRVEIWLSCGS